MFQLGGILLLLSMVVYRRPTGMLLTLFTQRDSDGDVVPARPERSCLSTPLRSNNLEIDCPGFRRVPAFRSQALSLLSDSIFWEHQSAYTVTMQLNTVRSNAADIQNAQNHTHTTHTYTRAGQAPRHPADRALCPPSRRRVHAQTYFSSTACYPSSFCTWRSCSHLHLHFLHFITPTRQASCQSLLHHTLLTLTKLHQQVSKCTVSRAQSESCCRVSSALNLCYLQTASTHLPPHIQHKLTKPRHFF